MSRRTVQTGPLGGWQGIALASFLAACAGLVLLAEVRAGPIVAGGAALAVYLGLTTLFDRIGRRAPTPVAPEEAVGDARDDAVVDLMADAEIAARRLDAAAKAARGPVALHMRQLAAQARAVKDQVLASPGRLDRVLRLFTYYLPAAADLAEDRVRLGGSAGPERLREIDSTLARLCEAFDGFARAALEPDLQEIDIDLRMIDQALAADLDGSRQR